jgi:opacity protein-like surface antigen
MGRPVEPGIGRGPAGWHIAAGIALLLSAYPALRLSAQIGHDPSHSPYHDIQRGSMVRFVYGYFSGSRGRIPVGPSKGPTFGLRYEIAASGVFTFAGGLTYTQTDAYYFDPLDTVAPRRGPVNNDLVMADLGLQASLTGGKSWHGLQPYVGATLGLVIGSTIGADTSGYSFGTKFSYGPEGGIRWYPTRRLSVELAYRLVVYSLDYPLSYRPTLIPITGSLSQATAHPWATIGVGWTF